MQVSKIEINDGSIQVCEPEFSEYRIFTFRLQMFKIRTNKYLPISSGLKNHMDDEDNGRHEAI